MCRLVPLSQTWRNAVPGLRKIHSMVHSAAEIMRWGSLINSSGEAAEGTHKINVKGPGANLNHRDGDGGTLLAHARRKETTRLLGAAIQGNT